MANYRVCALLTAVALAVLTDAGAAEKREECTISVRNLPVPEGEVIVSFQIDIVAGSIKAISNIPVGWYFALDNAASWQTTVKANSTVGAASLKPEDLMKLQFLVQKNEFGDLKFELSGVVSVTKDYEKERRLNLKAGDFVLTPAH